MNDQRVVTFLSESVRPFCEWTYKGLVDGEELLEFWDTEILPIVESAKTGVLVANPFYVDENTTPNEPAQIDETYLNVVSDYNSANGKAIVRVIDLVRIITLLKGIQNGLSTGNRSVLRKAVVRPVRS